MVKGKYMRIIREEFIIRGISELPMRKNGKGRKNDMMLLKITARIALMPVILVLIIFKCLLRIVSELSSIILGGLILLVFIYMIVMIWEKRWDMIPVPILIEACLMAATIGSAILEEIIDAALIQAVSI